MTRLELSVPGSPSMVRFVTKMPPEKLHDGIVQCLKLEGDYWVCLDNSEKTIFTILPKRVLLESIIHIEEE